MLLLYNNVSNAVPMWILQLRSAYFDGAKAKLAPGFMGDAPWVGMAASPQYAAALTRKGTLYVLKE